MEFNKKTLGEVCEVVTDYVANGSFKSLAENVKYQDNGFARVIRLVDFNNKYLLKDSIWVDEHGYEFLKKSKLYGGEIILTNVGANLGTVFIVPNLPYKMTLGPNAVMLKAKEEDLYLYYWLISPEGKNKVKSIVTGSAMPKFNKTDLKNLEIKIPNIENQRKIINVLVKIDKKIELNNQINDNLHDLVEQQFIKIYNSGNEKTLGDLLDNVSTGSRPKGGAQSVGIPSVGAEKIEKFGIYDYSSEKYISQDFYEKLKNGKMKSGDVLLYKDGAYTGKVSMCLNGFPHKESAVNEHVFILNTKDNWAQNYLYFTIYNRENKEMLERLASSKAAQPGLNQSELRSLKIKICDKETIENFEVNVRPIMENIANNSVENKNLAELRDMLLPKLMNGEIDLDKIEI